jgi:hypothetical protein
MKTKTFIQEETKQCIELEEIEPAVFAFFNGSLTLDKIMSAGWKLCPDPGYRGFPNLQKSNG